MGLRPVFGGALLAEALACLLSCLAGCSAPPAATEALIVRELLFVREEEGVSDGFDLDGRTSDEADAEGCGQVDLVGPNGETGVDNAFADSVLPALELTEGAALEPLIQNSINDGRLLLAMEVLEGGEEGPSCRKVHVLRALPPASVGGDDRLLAGQTFDRDLTAPESWISCASDDGDVVAGGGFELRLPLEIFDESIDLTLLGGLLELERLGDGMYQGRFGGGVAIDEVRTNVAALDGIGDEIPAIMDTVLDANADLAPNSAGFCTQMSVTFRFTAAIAFFYEGGEGE